MALADFVELPLLMNDGTTINNTRINVHNIIEVKVINLGRRDGRNQNWVVQVIMLMGKFYYLSLAGSPFVTQAQAEAARDTGLDNF